MPLQDVSNDHTMINWLRESGHSHLLDEQHHNGNTTSSPPPTSSSNYPPPTISSLNYPPPPPTSSSSYPPPVTSSPNYPAPTTSLSSPPPTFGGGYNSSDPLMNTLNRSGSFPRIDFQPTANYSGAAGSPSPPIIPQMSHFNAPSYDHQSSPLHFNASPTQFLAPSMNQQQLDVDIEVKYLF